MKQRVTGWWMVALVALAGTACGGGATEAESDEGGAMDHGRDTSGGEGGRVERDPEPVRTGGGASGSSGSSVAGGEPVTSEDGMEIEGILGALAPAAVTRAMQSRASRFSECFARRYDAIPVLGGAATLAFRVRTDGSIRWVHLTSSTVGDRETERCILGVAASIRVSPGPVGGEGEFEDTLNLESPDDVRPPVTWQPSRVRSTLRSAGTGLAACAVPGTNVRITVYVDPGATVAAVGASFLPNDPEVDSQAALDCLTQQVARWPFPDPGSYTAKVTFEAP